LHVAVLSGAQARQTGDVFSGPGAGKVNLPELDSRQEECLSKAKKYAAEQNVKIAIVRQTIAQQQQVRFSTNGINVMIYSDVYLSNFCTVSSCVCMS